MTETALTVTSGGTAVMPIMDIRTAIMRRQAIVDFVKEIMVKDRDFGKVPGTEKQVLLKPGAEKLTSFFGLSPRFDILEKDLDWTGELHGGEPFFYLQYRCSLYYGDILAGQGVGSCNSWEKKYRFRKGERSCPDCGANAIIKGKKEYGGGWLCYKNKGGCGAKWADGDPLIEKQEVGQIKNENPQDIVNTVDKISQKRSLIAAVLIAVNASEFFTQDLEDYTDIIEGAYEDIPLKPPQETTRRPNGSKPAIDDDSKGGRKEVTPPDMSPIPEGDNPKRTNGHHYDNEDEKAVWLSVSNFLPTAVRTINRYTTSEAVKGALKKLGYGGLPGGDENADLRVRMYRNIRNYAELRDQGMDEQAAIDAVLNVLQD